MTNIGIGLGLTSRLGKGESAVSYTDTVLEDSPLGFWPMNEPSGTTAFDVSGNDRNGSYSSCTLNQAELFPGGVASMIPSAPGRMQRSHTGWYPAAEWTVEVWVDFVEHGSSGNTRVIFQIFDLLGIRSVNSSGSFRPRFDVSGKFDNGVAGTDSYSAPIVSLDEHMLAINYVRSSKTARYFLDGAFLTQRVHSITTRETLPASPSDWIRFGSVATGSEGISHPGRQSHGAWFGSALSDERIAAHYASAVG